MTSADKELEEQLLEAGNKLLDPPSSVDELLPLLDQVESCLSRVEQSPTKAMQNALSASLKALVADKLIRHSDIDVKVAVASCISEITRITAPDAPYDDDQMKEVFQLIVSSFENLYDKSSPSYTKRASIVETVAKVRSCVVMLDLECDALILEMFQHFFKAVREHHQESVFSSMEIIMTLVIEESEDIPVDLLAPILASVKKDNEEVSPLAQKLGERVLESCATKLRPYLVQAVSTLGISLDDYSKVLATICQETPGSLEQNDVCTGEHVTDESKSAKEPLEESTQVVKEDSREAASPQQVNTVEDKSPKSVMSNGIAQAGEDNSLADSKSLKKQEDADHSDQLKGMNVSGNEERNNLDTDKVDNTEQKPEQATERKGRTSNSAKLAELSEGPAVANEKEADRLLDSKSQSKDILSSPQNDHSVEAPGHSENDKEINVQVSSPKAVEQPWKFFGTDDMPYQDQLLQSSPVTLITNSASSRPHLRAITASKRKKPGPHQIWEDSPMSTFRPRARPLFQYRHYSEQQPLRLNPAEVREVIAAVCSETSSPNTNVMTVTTRLRNNSGNPSMDVAVSVLIKLVIDMYVLDSQTAAPLTLSMLEDMLSSSKTACRIRAFDLILNLGVHAHLLEPMIADDASAIEEDYSQESYYDSDSQLMAQGSRKGNSHKNISSAIENFESWILNILYEILLLLVQTEEEEESVWASALSCLLYFVCDRGEIRRNRLLGLDIRVIKALIETSWKNSWAELVHCKLISMLTNMFYQVSDEATDAVPNTPKFLVDQLDLIGGVQFILIEYSLANSSEERRNLYSVLFDYVLHQINETCIATGVNEYSDDEIQPLAALLARTNAPDAFYISVKLGVEGIGEILRRSIASALPRYSNGERLNTLLEIVAEKFDAIISSFTHLDKEFSYMIQITKSHKFLENMEGVALGNSVGLKAKRSWATLHSLLHSERIAYRQNGYIWLSDLLIAEISGERNGSIWSNIKHLQQKIVHAGIQDSSDTSNVPLPISLMCGLLKSKDNFIRWGFLFVLERLLMRCKFLLDEHEMQHASSTDVGSGQNDWHLEKANAVIDIMSSALGLVFQINETDRINILKMCDILFSQLCLRVPPPTALPFGDDMQCDRNLKCMSQNKKSDGDNRVLKQDTFQWDEHNKEEADRRSNYSNNCYLDHETASMAALLLQGQAIVPMQLIARVPPALLYWPLIQLAGAATDNIALGVAVGSKGRGNLPGATSDIRATLLLLLIGKCTADPAAFQEVGLEQFFRELLDDTDSRVAYYSSAFLLKRMMTEKPEKYQHTLQNLVVRAQQSNNEKLLENPYLQMRGIIQLANDLGTDL